MLPADMQEINRLDFQHYLLRNAFHGNFAAPIGQPRAILDVGTGTGRWAREMALQFPYAHVIGLDITIPPTEEYPRAERVDLHPVNYHFVQGNALEGLPFPDGSFDFVHMRLMVLALTATGWPFVISELARVTAPGGWVESVEYGGSAGSPAISQLITWGTQASALRGIDTGYSRRVGALLRSAGLVNVQEQEIDIPLGAWGGRVGVMTSVNFLNAMKALSSLYINQGIATAPQVEQVLAAAQAEASSRQYRPFSPFFIAIGQKAFGA
jgi:ubiquinone/menaquinone biosynthesis C-methylase UbiE